MAAVPPQRIHLFQNYPNPFNPTTTIDFELPMEGVVSLALYDVTGRKVRDLVNRIHPAGYHTVIIQADGLASGVYLCRIEVGGFVAVRRLVLLK